MSHVLVSVALVLALVIPATAACDDPLPNTNRTIRKYALADGKADAVAKGLMIIDPELKAVALTSMNGILVLATEEKHAEIVEVLKIMKLAKVEPEPKKYALQFKDASWDDVLKWYAEASGLMATYREKPAGKVTLLTPKDWTYTLGEATDIINDALIQQKYILIRGERTFTVWPADEKLDRTLVPRVELSQLAGRGQAELVEVEVWLTAKEDAKAWAAELLKITTPFGSVVPIPGPRLVILDTAGNVRRLAALLSSVTDMKNRKKPVEPPKKPPVEQKTFTFPKKEMPWMPWTDVLQWYAEVSGLTPILPYKPTGLFIYTQRDPNRRYTIEEITDILNEALQPQKLILVRRQVTFFLHPADEKVDNMPPSRIELSDLRYRGKTELVQVLIPLRGLKASEAAPEFQKLLTPYGRISVLEKTNTLVVLDTAGNIARIWDMIQDIEDGGGSSFTYQCRNRKAQDIADALKANPEIKKNYTDKFVPYTGPDPRLDLRGKDAPRLEPLTITVDSKANKVTIVGPPDKVRLAKKIMEDLDSDPFLRKYGVAPGTADEVAKLLLKDIPNIRVLALPVTNEIMALGTEMEHKEIVAKLKELSENEKLPKPKK